MSHASDDKPLVEELARRLARENLRPWLDKWNLIPGTPWQREIEAALAECATCAVIIGRGELGPWHHEEMRQASASASRPASARFGSFPFCCRVWSARSEANFRRF